MIRQKYRNRLLGGAILLTGALLTLVPGLAGAQCDVPLIAQQVAVPPNVMILLDNSGSMNEVVYHEDYDPTVPHPGIFDTDLMYSVGGDFMYSPDGAISEAQLVMGLHGQAGRYLGNYLNWMFYVADDQQRADIPTVTRQMVANTAVKAVMTQAAGLRYGIAQFNNNEGGQIVADNGTATADLTNIVDNMVANTWTPTAETMMDIMDYFQDPSGPIQYECQQTFLIVVTDGYPTQDLDVPAWIGDQDGDGREPGTCESIGVPGGGTDCSDYMDDVAYYMANNDMRGDLDGDQIVNTYTIGFGIDAPLLLDTAANGEGLYRVAWNLETLVMELGTVVGDIVNRISAGAAVAVVSTEAGNDSHLYRGKFMPGLWRGFLEAYELPYSDGQSPQWEAGQILQSRSPGSRNIFTSIGNQRYDFETSYVDDLAPYLNGVSTEHNEQIIDYIRGEDLENTRDRDGWKLGDLVYSTPVVVGPPAQFFIDSSYQAFLNSYRDRKNVVYIGANDGMLHAFRASDGKEIWSYVPTAVMGKLQSLMDPNYCHQTFVDLSPGAYDVKVNGSWKTVIFGGQRTGGDSYFAIDVTNPESPYVLWETAVPALTSSFTVPTVVRTVWGPYLWTGSGPDFGGSSVYSILDIKNGNLLYSAALSNIGAVNMATAAVPFDSDYDGVDDVIYQGDLAGNLWRFDIAGTWLPQKLFTAPAGQSIQTRPSLSIDENGDTVVYFGTGRYVQSADIGTTGQQYFYAIKDPGDGSEVYKSDLVNQSSSISDTEGEPGWYFALENGAGERVTEPAIVVEGVVYFTSFAPSAAACEAGGQSWLYRVNYVDSDAIDEDEDGNTGDNSRSTSLGEGVASRPVINLAGEELIVQTSDARLQIEQLSVSPQTIQVRAWRERFADTYTETTQDPQQP